ncbi:MAG TPA: serine hydrolase [Haliangiales bacterium]|nr:serine hydrolase [Haliangiales bacterium]
MVRLAAIVLLAGCGATLAAQIDARVRAQPDAELVSVAYVELGDGATFLRDADARVHAASTMKLPVMMEVYRRVAAGELTLDFSVKVENRFHSIVDGSEYQLDPGDDADPEPYAREGQEAPVGWLVERMIVRSSNLATNLVIQLVGADAVTGMCRGLGATAIDVLRGVEDGKAHEAGRDNTATARDLMVLLRALGERRVAGADAMIDVLARQQLNEGIPAGLPAATRVAHKTGMIDRIYHDAALVLPERGGAYVLVVLTRGIADGGQAQRLVADLSRIVWDRRAR